MFKLPARPSPAASAHELADFAEIVCLQESGVSTAALTRLLVAQAENDYYDGVPEDDIEISEAVAEAFNEIHDRDSRCRDGYPFTFVRAQGLLRLKRENANHKHIVYQYLLLATRLNMQRERLQADINGALLFEELAAETARAYLGPRAESLVFGTAAGEQRFPAKVNELCRLIKEGDGYRQSGRALTYVQDGKLDIVAWKPFADNLAGKLIAFGQCKTGTHFKDEVTQLQPESFCRKWMRSFPVLIPMRTFFVAEALPQSDWFELASDAGLLFDRCRILDYCDNVSESVLRKVISWTQAARQGLAGM